MMNGLIKFKFKALLIHFSISVLFLGVFLSLVWFIWYPSPFLDLQGGLYVTAILIGVDLTLGPILTFIVYRPQKKGLAIDLSLIAAVQIIALLYGGQTIFSGRPLYVVYNDDKMSLISAAEIDIDALQDQSLTVGIFDQPQFVYVEMPTDPAKRTALIIAEITDGKSITSRPELYRDTSKFLDEIRENPNQLTLTSIMKLYPKQQTTINAIKSKYDINDKTMLYYPLIGQSGSMIIVLNKADGDMLGVLPVAPRPVSKLQQKALTEAKKQTSLL